MDELYDVENEIQKAAKLYGDTTRFADNIGKEIEKFIDNFQSGMQEKAQDLLKKINAGNNNIQNFQNFGFTGKITDLCYFSQSDTMPLTAIANISDKKIKDAVIENFDKCVSNGLLEMKGDYLNITDKGKQFINERSFKSQASSDQLQAYNNIVGKLNDEIKTGVSLTGNYMNDFTFFDHSDKLDLKNVIAHPDKKLSAQVLNNVKQWQMKGAVTVENGVATVTAQGKQMLKTQRFRQNVNALSPKSVIGNTSGIFIPLKNLPNTAKQTINLLKTIHRA